MTFVLHSASSGEVAPLLSRITTCHHFSHSNAEMSDKGLASRKLFPKAKKIRRTLVALGRGGRGLGRECLHAVFICGPLNPVRRASVFNQYHCWVGIMECSDFCLIHDKLEPGANQD